jgi:hypothetical protein
MFLHALATQRRIRRSYNRQTRIIRHIYLSTPYWPVRGQALNTGPHQNRADLSPFVGSFLAALAISNEPAKGATSLLSNYPYTFCHCSILLSLPVKLSGLFPQQFGQLSGLRSRIIASDDLPWALSEGSHFDNLCLGSTYTSAAASFTSTVSSSPS